MDLYEALKARKDLPVSDSFAMLYGKQTGGGGSDVEYFGAVPFELSAKGNQNAKEYTIYGNTFQNGTPSPDNPVEIQGVGERTANLLDASNIVWKSSNPVSLQAGYSYTFSAKIHSITGVSRIRYIIAYKNGKGTIYPVSENVNEGEIKKVSVTAQIDEDVESVKVQFVTNHPSSEEIFSEIMLNEGTEPLPYQPYGYKIPVVSEGKNRIDISKEKLQPVRNGDDAPLRYGIVTNTLEIGTYTLFYQGAVQLAYRIIVDGEYSEYTTTVPNSVTHINVKQKSKIIVYNGTAGQTFSNANVRELQLEKGTTATDYVPYRPPITTTLYLDKPLYEGDFVKKNGGNVEHREWGVKVFDGSETIKSGKQEGTELKFLSYRLEDSIGGSEINSIQQTHFRYGNPYSSGNTFPCASLVFHDYRFAITGTETIDEVKQWLKSEYDAGHPVTICYKLATPTEKAVDLPNLQLADGFNSIDVDTSVKPEGMQIKFKGEILSQQASLQMMDESTEEDTNDFEESEEIL